MVHRRLLFTEPTRCHCCKVLTMAGDARILCAKHLDCDCRHTFGRMSALDFWADLGSVVWRKSDKNLKEIVFLDPVILISAFRSIFTFYKGEKAETHKQIRGFFSNEELDERLIHFLKDDIELESARKAFIKRVKKLFEHAKLSFPYKNSHVTFPILLDRQAVPPEKWVIDEKAESISYILNYERSIPKGKLSEMLVGIFEMLDIKTNEAPPSDLFISPTTVIFPFSISENEKEKTLKATKGSDFKARIEFVDENSIESKSQEKEHNVIRLPFCRKVICQVTTTKKEACVLEGVKILLQDRVKALISDIQQPKSEGTACPVCLKELGDLPHFEKLKKKDVSLSKDWKPEDSEFKCEKGHTISQSSYLQHNLPTNGLQARFSGKRTGKSTMNAAASQSRNVRIFLSSRFADMKEVRESFTRYAQPWIENEAQKLGLTATFYDLRWGVSEEESKKGQTIKRCLDSVKDSDYFVCFLGSTHGWVPDRDKPQDWSENIEQKYSWTKDYPDASATELEIWGGCLKQNPDSYRSFFYERKNKKGDKDEELQAKLKTEIKKQNIVFPFEDVVDLVEMTKHHILNAMKQDLEILKVFENDETTIAQLREQFLVSPDHQLSAELVSKHIKDCVIENLKTLSQEQEKMVTPEALKDSPLKNPLACLLALSEVMRFGKFEDTTPKLKGYTKDCKSIEDVVNLSLESWEESYDVKTAKGTLVPLLLTQNGITPATLNEYIDNLGQGQSSQSKREAFFSLLESHGFVTSDVNERYLLSKNKHFQSAIQEKYLDSESKKQIAWQNYGRVLVKEIESLPSEKSELRVKLQEELLSCYEKAIAVAGGSFKGPQKEFVNALGGSKISVSLSYNIKIVHRLHSDCHKFKFETSDAFWVALLETSKYAAANLYKALETLDGLQETLFKSLSHWIEKEKEGSDYATLSQLYAGLESLAFKLKKPESEIRKYHENFLDCSLKSLGLNRAPV
eukprot:TRINITY_DN554_c0_g1_i10.p1 TRINITY_DN554_c0_g1~~TRINITY_DN554_c0_g1_i10.p1  ORF type:complete len:970 (-),score=231.99 TRINITY_DN554_c0_g1_i10:192-3101(-)